METSPSPFLRFGADRLGHPFQHPRLGDSGEVAGGGGRPRPGQVQPDRRRLDRMGPLDRLALHQYPQGLPPARAVGLRQSGGQVILNGAPLDMAAPFGGFKQSGNGREWGPCTFEAKALVGYQAG